MKEEFDIEGRLAVALIELKESLRTSTVKYLDGHIRDEDVISSATEIIKSFVGQFRRLRDQTGQLKLEGKMHAHLLLQLKKDLESHKCGKFVELRNSKSDNETGEFTVYVTVLSAGTISFLAVFHEKGWDRFLNIVK